MEEVKFEKRTQKQKVFDHIKITGSITSLEAIERYGITRLSARIYELEQDGIKISSIMEDGKNRYGEHVSYKRYMINESNRMF